VKRGSMSSVLHTSLAGALAIPERSLVNAAGYARALMVKPCVRNGLNIHDGHVTYKAVAEAFGMAYVPASEALKDQRGIAIKCPAKRAI
jgi:alanine dehydrogenase